MKEINMTARGGSACLGLLCKASQGQAAGGKKIISSCLFLLLLSGCNLVQIVPPEKNQGINESALINGSNLNSGLNNSQNLNESGQAGLANQISCQSQTISEKEDTYSISANYPACDIADQDKKQVLNQEIQKAIQNEISDFKDSLAQEPSPLPLPNVASTFDSNYNVDTATQNIISLDFTIDTYLNGAAHPNQYFMVFNYDLPKMAKINLADLFLPDSKYLDKLAEICKTEFSKKFTDLWFSEGCDPKAENYSNFIILPDSLKILIDTYQVAPRVAGSQELDLKYSDLNGSIDPNGVLADVIK